MRAIARPTVPDYRSCLLRHTARYAEKMRGSRPAKRRAASLSCSVRSGPTRARENTPAPSNTSKGDVSPQLIPPTSSTLAVSSPPLTPHVHKTLQIDHAPVRHRRYLYQQSSARPLRLLQRHSPVENKAVSQAGCACARAPTLAKRSLSADKAEATITDEVKKTALPPSTPTHLTLPTPPRLVYPLTSDYLFVHPHWATPD